MSFASLPILMGYVLGSALGPRFVQVDLLAISPIAGLPTAVSRVVLFLARRGARREGETGETATQVEGECLEDYRSRSSCSTRSATYSFKSDW